MKRILLTCLGIYFNYCHAQSGQWIWMKGDTLLNEDGYAPNFGVEDATYHPSGHFKPNSWVDDSGRFWMFGGVSYYNYFGWTDNFVWRFNPATNNWARMRADCCLGAFGQYGIQGVTDSSNYIGARAGSMLWKDNNGEIWVFGGQFTYGYYNDLWKYNMSTNEWTWIKGPDT